MMLNLLFKFSQMPSDATCFVSDIDSFVNYSVLIFTLKKKIHTKQLGIQIE